MNRHITTSLEGDNPQPRIFARARNVLGLLRFRAFDRTTEGGRSLERHRRLALSGLAAIFGKGVTVITTLISVPLTLHYLGSERYGLWLTISSMVAMLGFADMGIGNGLLTAVAQAHGRDDDVEAARIISSAFAMLCSVGLLLLTSFLIAYRFINWPTLLHVKSPEAVAEAGPAVMVFFCCFIANLPLDVVNRVLTGYQDGWKANLWTSIGNFGALGGVVAAWYFKAGLPWLVFGITGIPAVVMLINGLVLFGFERPHLRPRVHSVSLAIAANLLHTGIWFLLLSVAGSVAFLSDNFIIDQTLGPDSVPIFAIPMRLFGVPLMFLSLLLAPLWPAYGEAFARGDVGWIVRTLKRSVYLTLLVTIPAGIFLATFHRPLIHLWIGGNLPVSFWLVVGLCIWSIVSALGNTIAMFLNGLHVIRMQVIMGFGLAAVKIVFSLVGIHYFGITALIWSTLLAYLVCVAIPVMLFVPKKLRVIEASTGDTAINNQ